MLGKWEGLYQYAPDEKRNKITLFNFGIWKVLYQYKLDNYPDSLKNKRTLFTIEILECKGNKFSGKVTDDIKTDGMEGTGIIEGTFDSYGVKFIKKMPQSTSSLPDGRIIKKNKPHPEILYEGTFDNNRNKVSGVWNIKPRIIFHSFRIYVSGGQGIFEMNKVG